MAIRLIVGLGNPGTQYEKTRHNAGFWFTNLIAQTEKIGWQTAYSGNFSSFNFEGVSVKLLQPTTFMNRSGNSVIALTQFFKIAPPEILVCHDELDIPPGSIKLKKGGGIAGHNGLKDIVRVFGGDTDFWRLRIGIGHPRDLQPQQNVGDFVLHPPKNIERLSIEEALTRAHQQLAKLLSGNFSDAQKVLHR